MEVNCYTKYIYTQPSIDIVVDGNIVGTINNGEIKYVCAGANIYEVRYAGGKICTQLVSTLCDMFPFLQYHTLKGFW